MTAQGLNTSTPSEGGFLTGEVTMPYKLEGNCVVKADTGEKVKCHATHGEAVAHLRALMANVEDAAKAIWISRAEMEKVCPACAASMTAKGLERVSLAALKVNDDGDDDADLSDEDKQIITALYKLIEAGIVKIEWLPEPESEEQKAHRYHTAKMKRCLGHLEDQGAEPGKAHRICYAALGGAANKSLKFTGQSLDQRRQNIINAFLGQAGSDNGRNEAVQSNPYIREVFDDHVIVDRDGEFFAIGYREGADGQFLFDLEDKWRKVRLTYEEIKRMFGADMICVIGDGIKSLGDGKYSGTLIRFTPKGDYDLTKDRFDAQTYYRLKPGETKSADLYFHHAQPLKTKSGKQMQIADPIGAATMKFEDDRIAVVLEASQEYKEFLDEACKALAAQGLTLGLSSGTANHLVVREPEGDGFYVKRWILGDDVSITPTPAEHRNAVYALKSLPAIQIDDALLQHSAEGQPVGSSAPRTQGTNSNKVTQQQGVQAMDEKEIKALIDVTVEQGKQIKALTERLDKVVAALEKEPVRSTGVSVAPEQMYPYKALVRNKHGQIEDASGFGEFLMDVVSADSGTHSVAPRLANWADMHTKAIKAASGLNVEVPSQGGFFVQTDHSAELVRELFDTGDILSRVRKIPLGANADSITLNGVDETSRASTLWGGILAYWVQEATAPTATKPKFRQIRLEAKGLAALYYATDKLLKIAPALGAEVTMGFREAMTFKVEDAIINGTGVGKPLGLMNCGSIVSVTKETNQTAATIVQENMVKMKARLFNSSWKNAVWLANQDCIPQIDQLAFTIGTGGVLSPFVRYGEDGVTYVLGRPVLYVEHCQTLGTTGDLILWDPSSYYYIDLGAIEEASSIHVAFTTFDQAFRFGYYCDGQPKLASALTPAHGSNTLTNQVKVDTRG